MMTAAMMELLTARGIDVELADKLGLESVGGSGDRLAFPFHREGVEVRRKIWNPAPKDGESRWTAVKGGLRIPYGEDVLRDDSLIGEPLVITEGEFDRIIALQAGYRRVISVPDGAPMEPVKDPWGSEKYAWIEELRPFLSLERVKEVILATDGDAAGAALQHDLSVMLDRARCKFVRYPKAPPALAEGWRRERCKDLNDAWMAYGAKGVRAVIEGAEWVHVAEVMRMSQLPPLPPPVLFELNPRRWRLLGENLKVLMGAFMVVTGIPSFGKTTFVNDVLCDVACEHGLTIAWASFEQEPQTHHKRNLRSWFCQAAEYGLDAEQVAAADRWIEAQHVFVVPPEEEDADLDWLLDRLTVAVTRFGAKVVVIDPWNELEHARRPGETETEYTGRAIRALKRFARRFKVLVVVVAHPTKTVRDEAGKYRMPTAYDISGSANWFNKADYVVIVHRENDLDTLIKISKVKFHDIMGMPGAVICHYSKDEKRYVEVDRPSAIAA